MKLGKLFALVVAILSITSCCSKEKMNIEDYSWKLVELNGNANDAFVEAELFTLSFDKEEKRIAGAGGVNRYFGTYELGEGDLKLNLGGMTMMAGPNMELEDEMFNALKEVNKYETKKGVLVLKKDDKVVAKFKIVENK